MRLLIAEDDHVLYAERIRSACPELQLVASSQSEQLRTLAGECELWLGQPDLLAPLLREGLRPQWLQSTWAGITPLLAAGLPRDYRLSRAVGVFGQVMAEYVLGHMLAHERRLFARLAAQVEQRWDSLWNCVALPATPESRRLLPKWRPWTTCLG